MNKGLEALCYLDDIAHGRKMNVDPHELKLIIEKELKALKIIKEKKVSIDYLIYSISFDKEKALDNYNQWTMEYGGICLPLTQEEYELLKEVLL